jgi:ABC-type antimicrobial peptide transport system permease subunit
LAVVTITHTLLTSLRARRHDLAIVRALGAAPAVVRRSVHWQATLVTLVPALIGAPLGFVVGRVVFTALADDIGALSTPAFPSSGLGGVLIGVVVLANLVALWPARLARRWSTAAALRSE